MIPQVSHKTFLPQDVFDTDGLIAALGGDFYGVGKSMLYHKTRELMAEVVRLRASLAVVADAMASVGCSEGDGCSGDNCLRCYVLIAAGRAPVEPPPEDVADLPYVGGMSVVMDGIADVVACPPTRCDWGAMPSAGDRCRKCGAVATGNDRRIWRARERVRAFNERAAGRRA